MMGAPMIASLPMYQRPELVDAHNRYWALIRIHLSRAGIASPEALSQDAEEMSVWTAPGLVMSQTCGMPYRVRLHDRVALVGTPDYGVEGCPPGYYRSAIVVRKNDDRADLAAFEGAVFAYNDALSQSGYAAAYWHVTRHHPWFETCLQTGQHVDSARAVADGRADIASLDVVSWRLMREHDSWTRDLRVLEWTEPTPGLPYIARLGADVLAIFTAVRRAIADLPEGDRSRLGIRDVVSIPKAAYLAMPDP